MSSQALKPPSADHKLLALDGIRGVAILLVLIFHFTAWASERVATSLERATDIGQMGVDLFFVLSGFLITGILADARGSQGYFVNFYARRSLRIFPLYYAVIGLVVFGGPLLAPHNDKLAEVTAQQGWLWGYTVNVAEAIDNKWTFYGMNHFWSLDVEEQFYLVWPFLVALLAPARMARLCLVMIVFALGLRLWLTIDGHWLASYALMPCRMDELAAGGYAALLLRASPDPARLMRPAAAVTIGCTVLTIFLLSPAAAWLPNAAVLLPTLLSGLFAGAHLVAVLQPARRVFRTALESSWLRLFGRYSYGLYVIHHPLRQLFEYLFPPITLAAWFHSPGLGAAAFTLLSVTLSLGMAMLSFHLFESPLLSLKRHFEYNRAAPA